MRVISKTADEFCCHDYLVDALSLIEISTLAHLIMIIDRMLF